MADTKLLYMAGVGIIILTLIGMVLGVELPYTACIMAGTGAIIINSIIIITNKGE